MRSWFDRLRRLAGDVGHRDHAFPRGHVRQLRRAGHDVADGVDARLGGLLALVHLDEAPVQFDARGFQADVLRVRLAAHGDQQLLGFDGLGLAARERERRRLTPPAVPANVLRPWRRSPRGCRPS